VYAWPAVYVPVSAGVPIVGMPAAGTADVTGRQDATLRSGNRVILNCETTMNDNVRAFYQPTLQEIFQVLYKHAWARSDDKKTKNAAGMLSASGKLMLVGVNHLPEGFEPTDENLDNKIKDQLIIHAEEDVILNCAAGGIPTRGRTIVTCWASCLVCARMIIGAGIKKLIAHKEMHDRTYERYRADIKEAVRRLGVAGVEYELWSGKVGNCQSLINHEIWEP